MLKDNLKNVEERVQEACDRAGRKREEVTLIAVSKTKLIEMLQEIYDENIRDFGETSRILFVVNISSRLGVGSPLG